MTKAKRIPKKYTEEFRAQAVNLFLSQNKSAADVARELGVEPHLLRAWIRQSKSGEGKFLGNRTVLNELAQVKKELKTLY